MTDPDLSQLTESELAEGVNRAHAQARNAYKTFLHYVREVGEYLTAAKEKVGHGNFQTWVEEHTDLTYDTAVRYKRIAEKWDEVVEPNLARDPDLSLRSALGAIADARRKEKKTEPSKPLTGPSPDPPSGRKLDEKAAQVVALALDTPQEIHALYCGPGDVEERRERWRGFVQGLIGKLNGLDLGDYKPSEFRYGLPAGWWADPKVIAKYRELGEEINVPWSVEEGGSAA